MKTIPVPPVTGKRNPHSGLGILPYIAVGLMALFLFIGIALCYYFGKYGLLIMLFAAIGSVWYTIPKLWPTKKGPPTTTTVASVPKTKAGNVSPWYVALFYVALTSLILVISLLVAQHIYHNIQYEKNYGLGGLPQKTQQMIADERSVDPYPEIKTLEPGNVYKLKAGKKYKWYGQVDWTLTNDQPPIVMGWDKIGTYTLMVPPRDCEVLISAH